DPCCGVGCIKIDPADHAAHQLGGFRDAKHEHRLRLGRRSLYEDRALDLVYRKIRREVRNREIAIDRRKLRRQPTVVAAPKRPDMMMRIDPHHAGTGTGASASSRCAAFRSAQSASGTLVESAATLRSTSCGACPPSTRLATAGCARAKCNAAVDKATLCAAQTRSISATFFMTSGGASR